MELWMGVKLLLGNRKRGIFSLLGITGAVMGIIMTLSLGRGGREMIDSDLLAMGENRILIGGSTLTSRDLQMVEAMDFVEYGMFPESRVTIGEYVFIGYPKRALLKKGLKNLRLNEVIIDKNQMDKKPGERLSIGGRTYTVGGTYGERNPLETMRGGKRLMVSMETLNRNFGRGNYKSMVIAFPRGENSQEYIPIIINQLSRTRGVNDRIEILETPEIYKSVERVRVLVNRVLLTLSFIGFGIGTFSVVNLIGSSVKSNMSTMGILKSMGMERKRIVRIFFYEGLMVVVLGSFIGGILGVLGSYLGGRIVGIEPKFNFLEIILGIGLGMGVSLGLGLRPGIKGSKIDVIDALKG